MKLFIYYGKAIFAFWLFFYSPCHALPASIGQFLLKQRAVAPFLLSQYSATQRDLLLQNMSDLILKDFGYSAQSSPEFKIELLQRLSEKTAQEREPKKSVAPYAKLLEDENVLLLRDAYGGTLEGNVVNINYKNSLVPLHLRSSGPPSLDIELRGVFISPKAHSGACLRLNFDSHTKDFYISSINSSDLACPIVENRGGALLELAEDIAKKLKGERIHLDDASQIFCPKTKEALDLKALKIFQNGQGWYESKGYREENLEDHLVYRAKVEALREYKLSDLLKIINNEEQGSKNISLENDPRELFKKEYAEFQINNSDRLADFMSWIYGKDCSKYARIFNFFFGPKRPRGFNILIPDNNSLVKNLVQSPTP